MRGQPVIQTPFNFFTLNTIRWNDQDRRRMIDMVTIIVEQYRQKRGTR
jgi:hypothetical protein